MGIDNESNTRMPPLPPAEWKSIHRSILRGFSSEDGAVPNIFGTIARHPDLFQPWLALITFLSSRGHLANFDRELVVNRIALNAQSPYEWAQHARRLDAETLERLVEGPDHEGWSEWHRTLLRSVDEFCSSKYIGDANWAALSERFTDKQLLEFVFLCSQYLALAYALNTLRVQPESDDYSLPDNG
jgi:4-carboxymuconolactone decarboxylase